MTPDEQLKKWVAGESVHLGEKPDGMCCPDFSCCEPRNLAPREEREVFAAANEEKRHGMLMQFLGRGFKYLGDAKVHIAGSPD